MSKLPNLYNRPREELTKYRLGFMRKENQQVKLIDSSRENEPIASLIGATDFFLHDLIVVPLSQIPPEIEEISKKAAERILLPLSAIEALPNTAGGSRSKSRKRSLLDEARLSAEKLRLT
jgi:hypothetical protein